MGHEHVQDGEFAVVIPAFFLVRVPEVKDAAEVVRNTLRLGAKGQEIGRQWFVPVFTSQDVAERMATDLKKIDDKLRVVGIGNLKDWVTLLGALQANGDKYTAFDPQPNYVEHVAINGLLAGARKQLGERDPDPTSRAGDPGTGRSWLRRRPAAGRSDPPESGNDRASAETAGRAGGSRFGTG
jgi:hypothetical protein